MTEKAALKLVAAARAMVSQARPVAVSDGALELHTARTKLAQAEVDAKYAWTVAENARGYGPAFPVASNDTPTGRQLNRRVEVVIAPEPRASSSGGATGK